MKTEFTLVASLPEGEKVVDMIEHMGTIFVATQSQVFYLKDGVLTPLHFMFQKEPRYVEQGNRGSRPGGMATTKDGSSV